jgi:hypothetical protein
MTEAPLIFFLFSGKLERLFPSLIVSLAACTQSSIGRMLTADKRVTSFTLHGSGTLADMTDHGIVPSSDFISVLFLVIHKLELERNSTTL